MYPRLRAASASPVAADARYLMTSAESVSSGCEAGMGTEGVAGSGVPGDLVEGGVPAGLTGDEGGA